MCQCFATKVTVECFRSLQRIICLSFLCPLIYSPTPYAPFSFKPSMSTWQCTPMQVQAVYWAMGNFSGLRTLNTTLYSTSTPVTTSSSVMSWITWLPPSSILGFFSAFELVLLVKVLWIHVYNGTFINKKFLFFHSWNVFVHPDPYLLLGKGYDINIKFKDGYSPVSPLNIDLLWACF